MNILVQSYEHPYYRFESNEAKSLDTNIYKDKLDSMRDSIRNETKELTELLEADESKLVNRTNEI